MLVSPDGPLHGLPWAALPGSKQGTFLVHEYAFAVVPVPQLLPQLLRGKPRLANEQPSLLLAGGIDFGEQNARAAGAASRQTATSAGVQAGSQDRERGQRPPHPVRGRLPGHPGAGVPAKGQSYKGGSGRRHTVASFRPSGHPRVLRRRVEAVDPPGRAAGRAAAGRPASPCRGGRAAPGSALRAGVRRGRPGRTGVRKKQSSQPWRRPSWSWARWSWSSSAPATRVVVRWPAARGCWGCSVPSSSPVRGRWWPACGRCPTRRPTSSCAKLYGEVG